MFSNTSDLLIQSGTILLNETFFTLIKRYKMLLKIHETLLGTMFESKTRLAFSEFDFQF